MGEYLLKIIIPPLISSIMYGIWAILITALISAGANVGLVGIVAALFSVVLPAIYLHKKISRSRYVIHYAFFAAICYFIGIALFMVALTSSYLSNVYVWSSASVLVYYMLLRYKHYKGKVRSNLIFVSIIIALIGLAISNLPGIGFTPTILDVAYGVAMMLAFGFGSYFTAIGCSKAGSSIVVPQSLFELLLFILAFPILRMIGPIFGAHDLFIAILTGIAISFGYVVEIYAYKDADHKNKLEEFIDFEIIDLVSEGDIIIVLIASILIGSYTINGIIGLALLYIGISILYLAHSKTKKIKK